MYEFTFTIATIQIPMPPNKDGQNCILFSDEDSLNAICSLKDVSFNFYYFFNIFLQLMMEI